MKKLSPRDQELVALGAALGSNCVPCIEYHIPAARRAGLSDDEIEAAIQQAEKVRQVPINKVLATAEALLNAGATGGCAAQPDPANACAGGPRPSAASGCCG